MRLIPRNFLRAGKQRTKILLIAIALIVSFSYFVILPRRQAPRSALVSLVRKRDLADVVEMVRNVEDRYNRQFHHDWVFLSEDDFAPNFIETVSAFTSGRTIFRTIDRTHHWALPSTIDRDRLKADSERLSTLGVPYGGSSSYRMMCRFQAGLFTDYLPEYRYYARIDPDVKLFCDIDYDIFEYMWRKKIKFGFTISLKEIPHATENLWSTTMEYVENRGSTILHPNNCLNDFVDGAGDFCHFWSNFELADLELYRSQQYRDFFEHLDQTGGFFYYRWGDAPVHSLAAAMFLDRSEIHYFDDIGMYHRPNTNCPISREERLRRRCSCPEDRSLKKQDRKIFTFAEQSCTPKFLKVQGFPFPDGWTSVAAKSVKQKYEAEALAGSLAKAS